MDNFDLKKYLTEGKLLKENSNKEELIQQLVSLSASGELNADEINNINFQLKSARRKMFTNQITPDQRKATATKGAATKLKNAELDAAQEQVYKMLGIEKNLPAQFALDIGSHRDPELQKRFDDEVKKILNK
jgi:hypothetical protein